jgi:phosphatidylserine/phosphatidylglycerophosphate/cardiolipin synthase-like enzyme
MDGEENEVKLIIEPDDGVAPILRAIRRARERLDVVIFRFDRGEVHRAIEDAVARGVPVRALIAHTNRGGEKRLRKLEQALLDAGVTVARTADDLPRYHGKMLIADDVLYVCGFNLTRLDIDKSRSFGVATRNPALVREAGRLFEADSTRQPYVPGSASLVISPENARERLTGFIDGARHELLIYDEQVSDNAIQRVLAQRARAGVRIRILGKLEKDLPGIRTRKLADLRLHVRAMVRDGRSAFIGSQSLRRLELDGRREVGVLINDVRLARKLRAVFEADWTLSAGKKARSSVA